MSQQNTYSSSRPAVSVLLICYNQVAYIREALESIAAQVATVPIEVIIADDFSTDGTREIISAFVAERGANYHLLPRDRNLGASKSFRNAFSQCRGKYLAMMEGDDYWISPDKLQKQFDFLESNPDVALCGHRSFIRTGTNPELTPYLELPVGELTLDEILKQNYFTTSSLFYRTDLLQEVPPWLSELKLGDWPIQIILAFRGKVFLLRDYDSVYRLHGGGAWTSMSPLDRTLSIWEFRIMMAEKFPELLGTKLSPFLWMELDGLLRTEIAENRKSLFLSLLNRAMPFLEKSKPERASLARWAIRLRALGTPWPILMRAITSAGHFYRRLKSR